MCFDKEMVETTFCTTVNSPAGPLTLRAESDRLVELHFGLHGHRAELESEERNEILKETIRQLDAYFAGSLRSFELPLAPKGTGFQIAVWNALLEIPFGKTISYGELANLIGRPKAVRAVGAANGQNPIPIIIPCHRVIGADGSLTGYGGGLEIKRALLALEGQGRLFS